MDEKLRQLVTEAEAGSADAQYALGCEYSQGKKVSKDEAKTVELFLKAGAQGHMQAQYWLGVFYANARSVPKDDAKAVEWYRRSAEQDYAPAQYNMGVHYATGHGVARDAKKACEWLTRASNTGYARAQNYLGWMYDNGYGVEKDEQTAVNLYRKAAEQGYAAAQCNLAESYYQGTGVAKDDTKAIEWFRKAAEQDYDDAQYYLGNAYATGRGLPKDDTKAAEWYRKAAAQGNTKAKEALAKLGIPEEAPKDPREQPANQAVRQEPTGHAEEKYSPSNADCRPLLAACTPRLYADNAFRITGLAIRATTRDIRRRQEDLKAVEGTSDWQDEHTHALSLDEHPTPEQVNAAFLKLQDPERRLIDELFWFWPLTPGHGNRDEALQLLKNGKDTEACQIWENTPRHRTHDGLAAMHNLAIYHHLLAIEQEARSQHSRSKQPAAEELKVIMAHWQKAMSYWETIADEDAFWKLLTDRVRETNDPRLTTGFVRRLRATFPLAFDQINAILAAAYAEAGHFEHARRHVKYMEATQTGQDDVAKTVRTIFSPLEKRVNLLVEHAVTNSRKTPEDGLKNTRQLLDATKEPLAVAKGLLDETHTVRTILFDTVAEACYSCLIAYGNKTRDWQPCSELLTTIADLATDPELRQRILTNQATALRNHTLYANLTPIDKAPSLNTTNGCGTTLYGATDKDDETNSHISTYYFVLLGIPIIPLARYRVIPIEGGFRFLGKAPLRRFDKWHIAIVITAVIGLTLYGIIDSNESEYRPQSSYVPATAPTTRQTSSTMFTPTPAATMSLPRITLKSEIETDKAKATTLENDLREYDRQLDDLKERLDRYIRLQMIAEHNALVPEYNALLYRRKSTYTEYSQLIDEVNAKVQRYNATRY